MGAGGYNRITQDLVVDIETLVEPVLASDVEKYMAEYEPPKNYKTPEAILRHREKTEKGAIDKLIEERRFSIGGKRMISAALGRADPHEGVVEIESWAGDDLKAITKGIAGYLDKYKEYRLVGWNLKNFDLPEIVKSFHKTKTGPKYKPGKWDIIDLCTYPFYRTKLKDTAKAFGIETIGMDGSQVEQLYQDGDWEKIRAYNEDDVRITGEVYLAASMLFTF